jgi:hypothetical protein
MSSSDDWDAPPRNRRKSSLQAKPSIRSNASTAKSNTLDDTEEDYLAENLLQSKKAPQTSRWRLPDALPSPSSVSTNFQTASKLNPSTAPSSPEPQPYYQPPSVQFTGTATAALNSTVNTKQRMVLAIDFGTTFTGLFSTYLYFDYRLIFSKAWVMPFQIVRAQKMFRFISSPNGGLNRK